MTSRDNVKFLDEVIGASLNELYDDFKTTNRGKGWHQYFRTSKVGVVASSQGLLLLNQYEIDLTKYRSSADFIVQSQFLNIQDSNYGGWAYVSNMTEVANTECTCWALLALNAVANENANAIEKGLDWLIQNYISEGSNKGWGSVRECGVRTYSTCMALKTLKKLGKSDIIQFSEALITLKKNQRDDGGWGETSEGSSTLVHTAHSLLTLIECGVLISSSQIINGITWIHNSLNKQVYQGEKSMGYVEIFDLDFLVNGDKKTQRMTFYHSPLTYAVKALIKCGSTNVELIYNIIFRLLSENKNGHWHHPYLPNQTTTWAIYDALSLFKEFKDSSLYSEFSLFEYIDPNRAKEKFDLLIATVVPVEFVTLNRLFNFSDDSGTAYASKNGFWFYKYNHIRQGKRDLKCLITMVGTAGEVDCTMACSTAFAEFNFETAILCGIAAGNRKDVNKYSCVISDNIVAYEFQRLEKDNVVYRPRIYNIDLISKRLLDKSSLFSSFYLDIFKSYIKVLGLKTSLDPSFNVEDSKLKLGTIASGSKLIADSKTLETLKESIPVDKGIISAEMESGGFVPVCRENNVKWLVFRGISDFGGKDKNTKNKQLQPLAVASAVAGMVTFLNKMYE